MASNLQNLTVSIKCEFDDKGFNDALNKLKQLKKSLKLSLWQVIKLRIFNITLPKPKITIQELIDSDTELNRSKV
jgi:hypothetical protein